MQLLASRDLYVEDLKVTPFIDLEGSSARVLCRVTLCNTTPGIKKVSVTGTLSPHNFAGEPHAASTPVVLPPGVSQTDLWLDLDEPRLWWPWDMGAQNLYDAAVSVADEAGELDRVGDRIGLRHLRKEQASGWEIYLNGKRIFCRGPNYVSEQLQSAMTRARYEFDVQLMKDANMNMVRSYCVVEREEFYGRVRREGRHGVPGLPDHRPHEQPRRHRAPRRAAGPAHGQPALPAPVDRAVELGFAARHQELRETVPGAGHRLRRRGSAPLYPAGRQRLAVGHRQGEVRLADRLPSAGRLVPSRRPLRPVPDDGARRVQLRLLGGGTEHQAQGAAWSSSASTARRRRCRICRHWSGSSRRRTAGR